MTSDPAAFMSRIRNELQALRAHPDLEDTAIVGGMAVLLPKLHCRQVERWQPCPGLCPSVTPLPTCRAANQTYIPSKLYSVFSSKISGLLKIFRSHSVRSTGGSSSRQFNSINRALSKEREWFKSREGEQQGKTWTRRLPALLTLRQLRQRQQLPYPFFRASSPRHRRCLPHHRGPSFAPCSSAQHNCFFASSQDQPQAHLFCGSPKTHDTHTATPRHKHCSPACLSALWENQEQAALVKTQALVWYIRHRK